MKINYDIDTTIKFYQVHLKQKEERASRLKNRAKDRDGRMMGHWNRQRASQVQAVLA